MKRRYLACVALVGAILIVGLLARALAGEAPKDAVVSALSRRLGVAVSVGEARFDLASFLLLRPTLSLRDVAIGNLLTARRISARIALLPLAGRRIEIRSILIDAPRIAVDGTNLESLLKRLSSPPPLAAASQRAAGPKAALALDIDEFRISSGEVLISGEPPVRLGDLKLSVRNLSVGTRCRLELSAKFFGQGDSGFRIEGRTGPFAPQVLPIKGKLTLTLVPHEIPERIRRERFGALLRAPGDKSRVTLEASIQGDLYNNVAGPARVTLHTAPVDGDAPALFSAQKPLAAPAFHLQVLHARLRLGQGEWAGAADLRIRGQTMSGASRGSIRGADVNALLDAFTAGGGGKIHGLIDLPSYLLRFGGTTADLDGTARLSIKNGGIGATAFHALTCDLSLRQSRLDLGAIVFDSPALHFTGNGTIGFDGAIRFDLNAPPLGGGAASPIVLQGTLDRPRIAARSAPNR
jgi:uncharacterized protein involved in outer membrane biogenesis